MNAKARAAVIQEYCRELKVPRILREYPGVARDAAEGQWAYEDYLLPLLETEVLARRDSASKRRISSARFPDIKTLDQIDWQLLKGVSKPKIMELSSCEYLERGHDVVLAGPIGTGKTHLAIGLGVEAARRRYRVAFARAADLVRELHEAKDERLLGRLHQRYRKVHLLIIDELGFVPFDRAGGELLFNLLSDRYERHSTMVTTNLAFSEWVQVFGDEKLTAALLDRLTQDAHILTTKGPSCRRARRRNSG